MKVLVPLPGKPWRPSEGSPQDARDLEWAYGGTDTPVDLGPRGHRGSACPTSLPFPSWPSAGEASVFQFPLWLSFPTEGQVPVPWTSHVGGGVRRREKGPRRPSQNPKSVCRVRRSDAQREGPQATSPLSRWPRGAGFATRPSWPGLSLGAPCARRFPEQVVSLFVLEQHGAERGTASHGRGCH